MRVVIAIKLYSRCGRFAKTFPDHFSNDEWRDTLQSGWDEFFGDMQRETEHEKTLRHVPLFQDIPDAVRLDFEKRCVWKWYEVDSSIINHGDMSDEVYFLTHGRARVRIYSVTGKEVAFRELSAPDFFGEAAAIDKRPRSASVEAVEDSLVARMSAKDFWQTLATQPGATRHLLQHLTDMMRRLTDRIFEFSTLAVQNRIHAELLRLANSGTIENGRARLVPTPTHAEIASQISTHREAVSREMSRLAKLGLVKRDGHALVITDLERLEIMVHEAVGE